MRSASQQSLTVLLLEKAKLSPQKRPSQILFRFNFFLTYFLLQGFARNRNKTLFQLDANVEFESFGLEQRTRLSQVLV